MQEVTRRENGRKRVQTINEGESKTVQSQAHLADIKEVLAKYQQLGIKAHLEQTDLVFRDVTQFEDYNDLRRENAIAEQEFMKLPSKVRELFEHSHEVWLAAAHDPKWVEANRPRLEKLGLIDPEETPTATEVVEVPPAAPAAADGGSAT